MRLLLVAPMLVAVALGVPAAPAQAHQYDCTGKLLPGGPAEVGADCRYCEDPNGQATPTPDDCEAGYEGWHWVPCKLEINGVCVWS